MRLPYQTVSSLIKYEYQKHQENNTSLIFSDNNKFSLNLYLCYDSR